MNPAQRAKRLQAHQLRCQGLTYRQIGERMNCAHSTAASYVRAFDRDRDDILASLAADLLVHAVSGVQTSDAELHARHISAARELRLLLNSIDQVADRRQRRERRVAQEEEADVLKQVQAMEELYMMMDKHDIDDLTPHLDALDAPSAPNPTDTPTNGPAQPAPTANTPEQPDPKPEPRPSGSEHNRTKSNKAEQESSASPANHAKPRRKSDKPRRKRKKSQPAPQPAKHISHSYPQIPPPNPRFRDDDIPNPPFDVRNLRPADPNHPLVRKLAGL